MTEITAYDKYDRVAYHSVTPRTLTDEEIAEELNAWCVDVTENLTIIKRV